MLTKQDLGDLKHLAKESKLLDLVERLDAMIKDLEDPNNFVAVLHYETPKHGSCGGPSEDK